jgi:hypothetical protein
LRSFARAPVLHQLQVVVRQQRAGCGSPETVAAAMFADSLSSRPGRQYAFTVMSGGPPRIVSDVNHDFGQMCICDLHTACSVNESPQVITRTSRRGERYCYHREFVRSDCERSVGAPLRLIQNLLKLRFRYPQISRSCLVLPQFVSTPLGSKESDRDHAPLLKRNHARPIDRWSGPGPDLREQVVDCEFAKPAERLFRRMTESHAVCINPNGVSI